MILTRFVRRLGSSGLNVIQQTPKKFSNEPTGKIGISHKTNNFDRKILVWTGKYKKIEDVPENVGQQTMERARNRMRIKIANYMMAATALGCLLMVVLGKRDQAKGISVGQMAENWHEGLKKESSEGK
ncbi:hypothetical protein HHI36_016697 [Cryptolaemus montrouzieri]|uniref:Uncharacterized protein n=1 Tax=Cryptolaemus montrouzieri TaxID=559131 RepID=A0ABD2NKY5_9CUCU